MITGLLSIDPSKRYAAHEALVRDIFEPDPPGSSSSAGNQSSSSASSTPSRTKASLPAASSSGLHRAATDPSKVGDRHAREAQGEEPPSASRDRSSTTLSSGLNSGRLSQSGGSLTQPAAASSAAAAAVRRQSAPVTDASLGRGGVAPSLDKRLWDSGRIPVPTRSESSSAGVGAEGSSRLQPRVAAEARADPSPQHSRLPSPASRGQARTESLSAAGDRSQRMPSSMGNRASLPGDSKTAATKPAGAGGLPPAATAGLSGAGGAAAGQAAAGGARYRRSDGGAPAVGAVGGGDHGS